MKIIIKDNNTVPLFQPRWHVQGIIYNVDKVRSFKNKNKKSLIVYRACSM